MSVDTSQSGGTFLLDNGLVRVRLDSKSGSFAASSRGVRFLSRGRLTAGGGRARTVPLRGPLGTGRAVEIQHPGGDADLVMLFEGVPFVCVRSRMRNAARTTRLVCSVTPARLTVALGKPPAKLRVLGCDGLTDASDPDCRPAAVCGNRVCEGGTENCRSCPLDCRSLPSLGACCGDGACTLGENAWGCPVDCRR